MNKEYYKGIKGLVGKRILPTALAGSLIFSSAVTNNCEAYNLEEPTISYEDYLEDEIKVFINGRYVQFDDETGYPFIYEGSTLIPLRVVSEAFGARVKWNKDSQSVYVCKYDKEAIVKVGSDEITYNDLDKGVSETYSSSIGAIIKDGRTYIPLRGLFEAFSMNVRWESEKKEIHIETTEDLEYIDFKESVVIDIEDLELDDYDSFMFDGVAVSKDYVRILKNSNQYKVVIEGREAKILSLQYLYNIDYFYRKITDAKENYLKNSEYSIHLRNINYEEFLFSKSIRKQMDPFLVNVSYKQYDGDTFANGPLSIQVNYNNNKMVDVKLVIREAEKIADIIRGETSDVREQIKLAVHIICTDVKYGEGKNNIFGALIDKKTKCFGKSMAFKLVMDLLNIPCVSLDGNDKSGGGHAWNQVYVDGSWFVCCATLDLKLVPTDIDVLKQYETTNNIKNNVELIKLTYKFTQN